VRTVHLIQVVDENVDAVVAALDEAGITHWEKRSGPFTRFFFAGDWGVRIFVDAERADEARKIVDRVLEERR
jgi:hypothetical protein